MLLAAPQSEICGRGEQVRYAQTSSGVFWTEFPRSPMRSKLEKDQIRGSDQDREERNIRNKLQRWGMHKEKIMKLTQSGLELKDVIEKAIKDYVITNSEYEEIMKVAAKDGMVDDHEQRLLSQLQGLLENGTVKRVKG